ncbi:MAG: hypothetical protein J6P07_06435 [Spirochaetaceae bacterium]|nr:hypothetical protein [Spirochaetaceae bacterium]MBO7136425.1 hypothetical protein [Spirochaetaceae bacterium]
MVSVNGYFDGTACIATDTSQFRPNQRLVITALDEDYEAQPQLEEKKEKLAEMKKFFGSLTHEEAEDIRNHRVNFKERF